MAYNGEGTIYIPLAEFWEFVSRYHDLKGNTITSFSIDREDLVVDIAFSTDDKEITERSKIYLSKIDHFLEVVDRHGRTSCSDENVVNNGRCNRCTLLSFKKSQWWDPNVTIDITFFGRKLNEY